MAVVTRDPATTILGHRRDDADVAAWTLRHKGRIVNWRDAGLEGHPLIGAWAARALVDGRSYADLLYGELRAMVVASN